MSIDWNLARAFLATAEAGSLSQAARTLGLTQPTLSRQVATLEEDLEVVLFERIGKSLVLTETGQDLLRHVRSMGEAAESLRIAAASNKETLEGNVQVSALDSYCMYVLPRIIHRIRIAAPDISITLISTNSFSDLQRGEADIAIRMGRPNSDELIGKLVLETTAGFYASDDWVAKNGHPLRVSDLRPEDYVGFEDLPANAALLQTLGFDTPADRLRLGANQAAVIWELVRNGLGVGMMLREIADDTPGMQRVLQEVPPVPVQVWLVSHKALKASRRIRTVFDILAEELSNLRPPD